MLRYHKICLTIHLYLYSSLLRISKLENLRISLSENPSLFLCTLFPGCKYVWNFENQSAGKYNFEFMSLHQPSFDSLRWNRAQFGSLGKELNMNSLSTLPFPIQCSPNTMHCHSLGWISFLHQVTLHNFNFGDKNAVFEALQKTYQYELSWILSLIVITYYPQI